MELLDKLAGRILLEYGGQETRKRIRPRQITLEQVRLLLFKECDWRGRKLLFDSATIQKVPARNDDKPSNGKEDEKPCILEVSQGFTYLYKGPVPDANVIGEMIFGAVAMSYKGVSLKIHIMDEPTRIMCSKVFCVPSSRRVSRTDRQGSDADWRNSSSANTLGVPMAKEHSLPYSFSLDRGDSGFCGDQSPYSSIGSTHDYFSMCDFWDGCSQDDFVFHSPPGRKLSACSNGSWQRRSFQSAATRFALGHSSSHLSVPTGASLNTLDSQVYTSSSASSTSASLPRASPGRAARSKLGLALLITAQDPHHMEDIRRCVEHSLQLQALVCRLRVAALAAGAGGRFVSTLHTAASDAARWLSDLLYGPRVPPTWLGLATAEPRAATRRAGELLANLCSLLTQADTKHTNFFISTLLTHVLTYHLGWVTTVSPYDTVDPQTRPQPNSNDSDHKRPYNALWAQLTDLCGAIGVPPRAAKTIISGTSHNFINTLLTVLTYFVRSGEVTKTEYQYQYNNSAIKETKVVSVNNSHSHSGADDQKSQTKVNSGTVPETSGMKRTKTVNKLGDDSDNCLVVPSGNIQEDRSTSTLVDDSITQVSLNRQLSRSDCTLKRKPTMILPVQASLDSSLTSNSEEETEQNVVFVLGDNEKLVGLKNKSKDGTRVKKTSKIHNEPLDLSIVSQQTESNESSQTDGVKKPPESPSKCCSQTLQHSKQIKHSGFKFEFDKYPQIVTNYMKSKNLEILDRHYIGKPGNLKLDNFQFDPTVVPPIQEEKCETCYKCLQMESLLQTPTNASEMEYMTDIPRPIEPQYAKESLVEETVREMSPKTFVRTKTENTLVVNPKKVSDERARGSKELSRLEARRAERAREKNRVVRVNQMIEFPMPSVGSLDGVRKMRAGFDMSLLGGVTDHYVPDLILQGTKACPESWEGELRRDLELSTYLNKSLVTPVQAVAIIGDTNSWQVRVVGGSGGAAGMSSLVGAMLDALPAMRRANVPAHQCLFYLEGKLREVCVLSKTLADMLMSTDLCDIDTLTKALNIDVNDVPLLLAVATTHTPQIATRYGISYR